MAEPHTNKFHEPPTTTESQIYDLQTCMGHVEAGRPVITRRCQSGTNEIHAALSEPSRT